MTDEIEAKAENCRLAMKAAMEAIQDYCGMEPTDDFSFPDEIYELATSDKDFGIRIDDVAANDWTKEQAREMFRELQQRPGTTEEQDMHYQDSKSFLLAQRIVMLTEDYDRAEAERRHAKWYATTLD